tara:strand:+ start:103 stop:204 length:102 start_codon:yes stop_codon:yes gene_type:complete
VLGSVDKDFGSVELVGKLYLGDYESSKMVMGRV